MRIVKSFEVSSKDDSKLQLPAECVQNGILTLFTQLIYIHSRRKQGQQAEECEDLAQETLIFCE